MILAIKVRFLASHYCQRLVCKLPLCSAYMEAFVCLTRCLLIAWTPFSKLVCCCMGLQL